MRARRLLAGLALAGLAATACTAGDDSDDAAAGRDDGGGGTSDVTAVGVTEDTLRLGVAGVDPADVEALGLEADFVGTEPLYDAWIAAQNERGGVAGRQIEMVFEPFLPIGPAEMEAACVALTEDNPVFLVIGIFTDDGPLCFTEEHDTPYLGHFGLSQEREERSTAPFVALEISDERQRVAGIEAMSDAGLLDGRVALYSKSVDAAVVAEAIEPALEELGVDVVVETTLEDFGADQAAIDQAVDVVVEKIRAADADAVLNVSDFGDPMLGFQRAGWTPERILSTSAQGVAEGTLESLGIEPAVLEPLTIATVYTPPVDDLLADPELQACFDEYNASDPTEPLDIETADRDTLNGVGQSCAAFRLFVRAAEEAGPDLTPESWLAAAESLGDVELPGMPFASLGPDKHSVGDAVAVYEYDPAAAAMVLVGEPIEAGV